MTALRDLFMYVLLYGFVCVIIVETIRGVINMSDFSILKGKTLNIIDGLVTSSERVIFTDTEGVEYLMHHVSDCCERVQVEDVIGDVENILDSPITMAEEVTSGEHPDDYKPSGWEESFTWTFYKLATIKGYVTIRWLGESNGYYSESVDFEIL